MKFESVIVSYVIKIFNIISYYYKKSMLYYIFHQLGQVLKRLGENSFIVTMLTKEWSMVDSFSNSIFYKLFYRILKKMVKCYKNSSLKFKNIIEESLFIGLLYKKMVFYLICFIVFGIPFFPTKLLIGLTALVFLLYIIEICLGKEVIHKPNLVDFMLFMFSICLVYATITSYEVKKAVQILLVYLVFILFYIVIKGKVRTKKQLKIIFNVIIVSGTLVALYGIWQYIIGVPVDRAWVDSSMFKDVKTRVYSTFGNPNVLGEYLIVVAMVSIGMLWDVKNGFYKVIFLFTSAVLVLCLGLTLSRGAWLGIILACFLFALFIERKLILAGIVALFFMPFILPSSILMRFSSISNLHETSSSYRISIWHACINIIKVYWPSGIGIGAFDNVYPIYSLEAAYAYHSHNTFLQIMIEMGIVGFIVFLLMIFFFFQRLLSRFMMSKDREIKIFLGAIFAGMSGYLLQGMVDHIWFNYSILLFFWVLLGLGISISKIGNVGGIYD